MADGLAFDGDPEPDGLDDVLTVEVLGGRVHRGLCDRLPRRQTARWSPDVAGIDDRACPECLPSGLPEL